MMKRFLKDTRGNFSIIFTILAMIAVSVIVAMSGILRQNFVLNEVQGVMDMAGVGALRMSVELEPAKEDEFIFKHEVAESYFNQTMDKHIQPGSYIKYTNSQVIDINNSLYESGPGAIGYSRQVWMDTVTMIRVESSFLFDLFPGLEKRFYDAYSDENFTVSLGGIREDGQRELIIRSVSRVIFH